MKCEEKKRLAGEYSAAADKLAETVADLQTRIGTSKKVEYYEILRVTEQARMDMEQARLNLERHISTHGC